MANITELESPLRFSELFGLHPPKKRLAEFLLMLRGDPHTPPSRFGPSSLKILAGSLSLRTWLGKVRDDRRIPLYNLFNHTQTPVEEGWSVRVTNVEDFRGRQNTYDSHNGTDFAVPPGTVVVAAAPGRVLRVSNEFHRGGLKILVDHGQGLMTTSNHLGRALVQNGQFVARGAPIALSGASGVDMVCAFPWNCPHVHYNVWLNGEPVDPFARQGEPSLWRYHNDPRPLHRQAVNDEEWNPSPWSEAGVERAIDACIDGRLRRELRGLRGLDFRAASTLFYLNYFPTRFRERPCLYEERFPRTPRLDLPFRAEDFDGVVHRDR